MNANDIAAALLGVIGVNDDEATVKSFLSTGYPPLNYALSSNWNGGLAVGRINEIAGKPSSGKTAIATAAMSDAQKQGGLAFFLDHERSFSLALGQRIGLDPTPGRFIYKQPRTFEESLGVVIKASTIIREKKLIDPEAPICAVFDSLASMVPQSALLDAKTGKEKDFSERNMNDNTALARATSAHFPAFQLHCAELNICAIFLNQVRTNIGGYGSPDTTPGGKAPEFYASQRIMLSAAKIPKGAGATLEIIGSQIKATVIKNKVSRPFATATWRFEFEPDGSGKFNFYHSMLDFLVNEKILSSAAGRVEWKGSKIFTAQLADKLENEGAWGELTALLPKAYEPEIVAEIAA